MQKEQGRASGGPPLWKRCVEAMRANKKLELAVYGGIIVIVALLYIAGLSSGKGEKRAEASTTQPAAAPQSQTDLETRLKTVLSSIRGAGEVEVLITYESGSELVTAMSTNVNSNRSETSDGEKTSTNTQTTEVSQPATVNSSNGNEPIILVEKQPVVRGVIVVAEGAADIRVKLDLQRAVTAVLDIPISKIEVFELSAAQP